MKKTYFSSPSRPFFRPSVFFRIYNIVYIEEAKTNYYVSAVYAQAESAPEGWKEDAEFTGTPVSFPYFGNATTLYARFETERI